MLVLASIWALLPQFWPVIGVVGTLLGLFMDFLGFRTWLSEKMRSGASGQSSPTPSSQVRQGLLLAAGASTAAAADVVLHHGEAFAAVGGVPDTHHPIAMTGEIQSLGDLPDFPDAPDHPLSHIGQIIDSLDPTS